MQYFTSKTWFCEFSFKNQLKFPFSFLKCPSETAWKVGSKLSHKAQGVEISLITETLRHSYSEQRLIPDWKQSKEIQNETFKRTSSWRWCCSYTRKLELLTKWLNPLLDIKMKKKWTKLQQERKIYVAEADERNRWAEHFQEVSLDSARHQYHILLKYYEPKPFNVNNNQLRCQQYTQQPRS